MRFAKPSLSAALIVALGAAAIASAQTAGPKPADAAKPPPVPLLWKVSDADNAVYVLGSFHLLKPDDYPLSKDVDAAFADAESVVFEVSPEEMNSPALAMQMGQAALRTDGTTLDSALSPATARKLQAWTSANAAEMRKAGVSAQALQMFEPWFVGLTITIVEMTKMGLQPELGLDMHFMKAARGANKPTSGLETGAQQIAFLDGMGAEEAMQFLDEALSESAEGRKEVEKLHAAWRAGDEKTMWDGLVAEMRKKFPKLYRRINVERNDAWVPKLEARLKRAGDDDTLVVVGALHTIGSDGIVEKLRAKGYTVERVCSACGAAKSGK